jgi:hypothetical protein
MRIIRFVKLDFPIERMFILGNTDNVVLLRKMRTYHLRINISYNERRS